MKNILKPEGYSSSSSTPSTLFSVTSPSLVMSEAGIEMPSSDVFSRMRDAGVWSPARVDAVDMGRSASLGTSREVAPIVVD